MQVGKSSKKAKCIRNTLRKPPEANAKVLATLCPVCAPSGTKQPLKFDPTDECVAAEAHSRKKATKPVKGRAKTLKVILLN